MPKTANKDSKNHTYCILKERLVNCIYPPGTLLNEAQLAADLGASRTPVREAISRLEMESTCSLRRGVTYRFPTYFAYQ